MSASPAEPGVSVVVGSNGAPDALERCLAALAPQLDGAEVLVCEPEPTPDGVRARFPFARFLERPGALVPALWRDGIDASRGRIVALTISPMKPASNWLETIRAELTHADVVGGAIDPDGDLRLSDWAEYFCRYARDMLPFERHESVDLPGDNAAYRREVLERTSHLYRDGFWEPDVHRALRTEGAQLWHAPALLVRQGRSAGVAAFVHQRLAHGRAYGKQRGSRFSRARNVLGVAAAPAVPALLTARILVTVAAKRRYRLRALVAVPLIVAFNAAWAIGEARGHLDVLRRR